ncbi:MAG TPA: hypothetical protein VJ999_08730 [Candidatus Sulfotelmatobacter sp.]|nr:hypothetical protein [Candidatus Sulfotelmatobacter sp.]
MQAWVLQEDDFQGKVKRTSRPRYSFYLYSLWRSRTGEHLFDGVAGDLAEAMDTMRAHIRHLTARAEPIAGE